MNSPDTKITRYKKFHIYSVLNKVLHRSNTQQTALTSMICKSYPDMGSNMNTAESGLKEH